MNKNFKIISLFVAGVTTAVLVATPVFAQTATATQNKPKVPVVSLATIIARADKEINQRVQSLSNVITRLGSMKKISSTEQSTLTSSIQNEISQLSTLKAKIDADTTIATARTDYASITKSYRIYALVLPQTLITAASDRVLTIVDSMNTVGTKIQSRISTLTGGNLTAINQLFSDFTSKIADASSQAGTATNAVINLVPDQGDKAKFQANAAALKSARANIKTATSDLVAARKDVGTIVKDLKGMEKVKTNNNSAATPQAQQ